MKNNITKDIGERGNWEPMGHSPSCYVQSPPLNEALAYKQCLD